MKIEDAPRVLVLFPLALVAAVGAGVLVAGEIAVGYGVSVVALLSYVVVFGSRLDRRLFALAGSVATLGLGAVFLVGGTFVGWFYALGPNTELVGAGLVALGLGGLLVRASLRWAGAVGAASHRDYEDASGGELWYYVVASAVVLVAGVAGTLFGRDRSWDSLLVGGFALSVVGYGATVVTSLPDPGPGGVLVVATVGLAATFAGSHWRAFDGTAQPSVRLFLAAAAAEGTAGARSTPRRARSVLSALSPSNRSTGDPTPTGGSAEDGGSGTGALESLDAALRYPIDLATAATERATSSDAGGGSRQAPDTGPDVPATCQNCGVDGVEAGVRRYEVVPEEGFEVPLCKDCGGARATHGEVDACDPTAHGIDPERVRNRDDRRCRACGREEGTPIGPVLAVHPVVPLASEGHRHDRNVLSLCTTCHDSAHGE